MLIVQTIARIRREFHVNNKPIEAIARDLGLSRDAVRKVLPSDETSFSYERETQPMPRRGRWRKELDGLLTANAGNVRKEKLTIIRIWEELRELGFEGGCKAAMTRFAALIRAK